MLKRTAKGIAAERSAPVHTVDDRRIGHPSKRPLAILLAAMGLSVAGCAEAAVEPSEPVNRAPTAVGAIPDQSVSVGGVDTLDVSGYFRDADGDALTYVVETSDAGVVTASVVGSTVTLSGVAEGDATATVTARDPGGSSALQEFDVSVFPFLASITVSPASDTIAPSDVEWLAATATGPDGETVDGVDFKWSSSNPTVVRVVGPGIHQSSRSDSVRIQGELDGTATIAATGHGASGTSTITVVNPDPMALAALYDATDGPNWRMKTNWLTDSPIASWHGVVGNVYHRAVKLYLQGNGLNGEVPPELGQLSFLRELALSDNPDLSGELPLSLAELRELRVLTANETGLCVPPEPGLLTWLEGVDRAWIRRCDSEATQVYLTQAVQSREFPVPLVAGDPALLRVFLMAGRAAANIPPVRVRLYLPDGADRVVDIPGSDIPIPMAVSEGSLATSANAEIDGSLVQPGLELVVEVDPEGTLDPDLGITKRIPESGRLAVDVRTMPTFRLTLIPFLLDTRPDSSVLRISRAMSSNPLNHTLLGKTRTLLPVGDMDIVLHDPVVTSSTASESVLRETELIRVLEAGTGYYLGTMAGPVADHHGRAYQHGRSSFSVVDRGSRSEFVIAHELGHNMSLQHPPGCAAGDPDLAFPHSRGKIGAWGYDFRFGGQLVSPNTGDLMSYCEYDWISDYHFTNALRYRLVDEGTSAAAAAPSRSLLLWGGVSSGGEPYLEPVFVADAAAKLPESGGPFKLTGRTAGGEEVFSLRFDMQEVADGDGSSGFAFVLPVQPGWAEALAGISLSGPGGTALLTRNTDRPVTILREARTGRVRGILRYASGAGPVEADVAAASTSTPELEVHSSRGLPGPAAWWQPL